MQSKKFVDGTVSQKNPFDWNEALKTVGGTLTGIFSKPDTYVTTNNYTNDDEDKEKDNTMLYVGIGAGVLVLVVLIIIMMKR